MKPPENLQRFKDSLNNVISDLESRAKPAPNIVVEHYRKKLAAYLHIREILKHVDSEYEAILTVQKLIDDGGLV